MLPPRSMKLVDSTPIAQLKTGWKACVELTVYPDGHAGIAVSEIEGAPPNRRIAQRDSLPLNDLHELRIHVLAVIDHLADSADAPGRGSGNPAQAVDERWSIADLQRELGRFEQELRAAQLSEASVETDTGRSSIFLRWLMGDYQPTGPPLRQLAARQPWRIGARTWAEVAPRRTSRKIVRS